ncbi:MAG: CCA tRNA nucleotidyltransferase [Pseudomonadota bacterium]
MKVNAPFLKDPDVQKMLTLFGPDEVYFVGGCVRNLLLNVPISDLDISTPVLPNDVMLRAAQAGLKSIPTGIEHGTVAVIVGGTPFEITTFRKDVETDGRRAVVAFAKTLEEDAQRRDFTMNALYLKPDGLIADPVAGLPDLETRHFRFIGNPSTRIREDALRILRFFRLHACYGAGKLNAAGLSACADHVALIDTLSRERIGSEFQKLLTASAPARVLQKMEAIGALGLVLKEATLSDLEAGLSGWPEGDWLYRLALLAGNDASGDLRLSRAEANQLERILSASRHEDDPAALGFKFGVYVGRAALHLRAARSGQVLSPTDIKSLQRGAEAKFPLVASDLMGQFQGAELGMALRRAEALWIASDFKLSRPDILAALQKND